MSDLFRDLHKTEYLGSWRPQEPPSLDGVDEICLDTETTGLRWWEGDRPIGISITLPEGKTQYLPWGHAGGNLDEDQVKRWAQRELRGKRITNLNTRFDNHMLYVWGVDLEAQGCILSDVGHYNALLDDHTRNFSLEKISQQWLGRGKIDDGLDKSRMKEYHAGQVAAYAEMDVALVRDLKIKMWPELDKQNLQRVRQLEDEVIFVVCEMERNGIPLDLELLDKWVKRSEAEFLKILWRIHKDTGLKFEPTTAGWLKLFQHEGIPVKDRTKPTESNPDGNPSFTDEILKGIDNPRVKMGRRAAQLKSLKAKYLDNFQRRVSSDGILRYALHQLRAVKDDRDEDAAGTISGRFSSTEITDGVGVNGQQLMKVTKQRTKFGFDEKDSSHDDEIYVVRKLIKPATGEWLSGDAEQIEYRLFADKAKNPGVIEAYKKNPRLKFHDEMMERLRVHRPGMTYSQTKNTNFMQIYGGGMAKLAFMVGLISKSKLEELQAEFPKGVPRNHPALEGAVQIAEIYAKVMPEVAPLLKRAADTARDRGHVFTLMGRRMRFPDKQRLHKAFNGVIQGTAADIMKVKLVELHKARGYTDLLLRLTVHDEVDGDARERHTEERVREVLDSQSFPQLTVPILWDVGTGSTWGDCA